MFEKEIVHMSGMYSMVTSPSQAGRRNVTALAIVA